MSLWIRRGIQNTYGKRWWSTLSHSDSVLTIHSLDASFPYSWLRDSCPCTSQPNSSSPCTHPTTAQKLHSTSSIPSTIQPSSVSLSDVPTTGQGLHITWPDSHQSFFPRAFLETHASPSALARFHSPLAVPTPIGWTVPLLSASPTLFLPYGSLGTPRGLLAAFTQLLQYGLLFVTGVPHDETADAACELPRLAELFGEIRETFYGRLWDVVSKEGSRNIAYTDLELGLHMDLMYFAHPPRYQFLHCLRNKVHGGTSIFVDCLHAATALGATHPSEFGVLASTPVAFHYINDGHHLHHTHPTIEVAPFTPSAPASQAISHISYSPPFQAPLSLHTTPPAFYPAVACFASLLEEPERRFKYKLREGDAVVFDNRRVAHARSRFWGSTGSEQGQGPRRWLKGCYIEADAVLDRARVLRKKVERG